ncbi:MAG: four helix bundle protein [Rhodothermales bacterium]
MSRRKPVDSYRDLEVWQRGMDLVESVYALTKPFPADERFGLTAQLRRAAISIPSNVAEGWGRGSRKEFMHFIKIARGSLAEVETQLIIAHRLGYLEEEPLQRTLDDATIEGKMLTALLRSLENKT